MVDPLASLVDEFGGVHVWSPSHRWLHTWHERPHVVEGVHDIGDEGHRCWCQPTIWEQCACRRTSEDETPLCGNCLDGWYAAPLSVYTQPDDGGTRAVFHGRMRNALLTPF